MSRIGFNIHATTRNLDTTKLLMHIERSQSPWMLVMDGMSLCRQIKNVSSKTNVIARIYPDEEIWKQKTPAQWIEQKKGEIGDSGAWAYTVNEQGLSDALCDWHSEVITRSESAGLKLVVGNLSAGTPQADDWTRPSVIALLKLLDKHRQHVVLGLHEYACGVITSGFLGGWPDNAGVAPVPGNEGKGRNLILPANWPQRTEVSRITRFHCGRFKFLTDACKLLNITPPRIVLTEHGFDDMSDIKAWALRQPQTAPYTSLRGWKSLENFWRANYSSMGWTPQRAMFEQLAYADQVLYQSSPVEGQLIFCWGQSSNEWDQFDVSGATELHKLIAEQPDIVPLPIPPTPIPVPVPFPPAPSLPPLTESELMAIKQAHDDLITAATYTRRVSLEIAAFSDELLEDARLIEALLKARGITL